MSRSHHSKYYFDSEMALFLVENRLFKVHRHFLTRDSAVFQRMFDCPTPQDGEEGSSDEKPIPLPGVTCPEFETLLDFFYEGMYRYREFEREELINLLSIATRFGFERIRQLTIDTLGKGIFRPLDFISLGERFDVEQWLRRAYIALSWRDEPLGVNEMKELGYEKATLVVKARERRFECLAWSASEEDDVNMTIINQVFFPHHEQS